MSEMFDINLISQIQGLDKKSSISKERPGLKRKAPDDKHKGRHYNDSKTMKNTDSYNNNNDNFSSEDEDQAFIDITV